MPDTKGRPTFSDFPDIDGIERALEYAPDKWRWTLVVWEYALLRAERDGHGRPSDIDLYILNRARSLAHPGVIALLVGSWVALTAFALSAVLASGPPDDSAVPILAAAGAVGLIFLVGLMGPESRAMRLVRASRRLARPERRAMLERALEAKHWWS